MCLRHVRTMNEWQHDPLLVLLLIKTNRVSNASWVNGFVASEAVTSAICHLRIKCHTQTDTQLWSACFCLFYTKEHTSVPM